MTRKIMLTSNKGVWCVGMTALRIHKGLSLEPNVNELTDHNMSGTRHTR